MRYIKKFESESNWQDNCHQYVFNLVRDRVGEMFDIFNDIIDEYDVDINMDVAINIDPYEDELYHHPHHLMTIDSGMNIFLKSDIEFMSAYIPSKNWEYLSEDEIIYCSKISTEDMELEYVSEVSKKFIDRVSSMWGLYVIHIRSNHFINGITKEVKYFFKLK